jgi:hypothetical protein
MSKVSFKAAVNTIRCDEEHEFKAVLRICPGLTSMYQEGYTLLLHALYSKRRNMALHILAQRVVAIDVIDGRGNTALIVATRWGWSEVVDRLLTLGANPTLPCVKSKMTALDYVLDYECRQFNADCNQETKDRLGETYMAMKYSLLAAELSHAVIHKAGVDRIKNLIIQGASVENACMLGRELFAREVRHANADVRDELKHGLQFSLDTAEFAQGMLDIASHVLICAIRCRYVGLFDKALRWGARMDCRNRFGVTPESALQDAGYSTLKEMKQMHWTIRQRQAGSSVVAGAGASSKRKKPVDVIDLVTGDGDAVGADGCAAAGAPVLK